MWSEKSKFEGKGSKLVFIGNGSPNLIKAFKQDLGITVPVYTDPGLAVFAMAGFKRTILGTISPKSVVNMVNLKKQGYTGSGIQGDLWQQGGVLAVGRQGQILFHFVSKNIGDFPPQGEIESASEAEPL